MKLSRLDKFWNSVDSIGQIVTMSGIVLVIAILVAFTLDREPPFKLLAYSVNTVVPGQQMHVDAVVKRDLDRRCTVKYSKAMYDWRGSRFWATGPEYTSRSGLDELNRITPNELRLSVDIPDNAPIGKIEYVTNLDYVCNPLHLIWPIEVIMRIETEVKAPK